MERLYIKANSNATLMEVKVVSKYHILKLNFHYLIVLFIV